MTPRPPSNAPVTASEIAHESRRVADDLAAAIRDVLPRHGIAGTVVIRGNQAELHQGGPPISVDVHWVLEQWSVLPPDMRERKAVEVSRRLIEAHQKATGGRPGTNEGGRSPLVYVGAALGIALLGSVAWFLMRPDASGDTAPIAPVGEPESERAERMRTTCESERANIFHGRPIDQFGMEGWVTELWLAAKTSEPLAQHPALTKLLSGGKLAVTGDPILDSLSGEVTVAPGFDAKLAERTKGFDAVVLRFSGGYVPALMTKSEVHDRILALSEQVAVDTNASLAGLVARCAHLRYRDVGVWFRGRNQAEAVAALFYTVGVFAEAQSVDYVKAAALSPDNDIDGMIAAAGRVDALALNGAVAPSNGSVKIDPTTKAVSLTFPLLGYTTALKASAELAGKAQVAR